MMETSLSGRIAERAKKQRASKRERNRAVVLALRQEIHQAMADGWPVATIWRTLHEEKKVDFSYQAFRLYVNKLVRKQTGASIGPLPVLRKPVSSTKTSTPSRTGTGGGFTFDPTPKKEDLI